MMRTLLAPLGRGLSGEPALDAALSLAKRLNSHIRAVFVRPDPSVALSPLPSAIATMQMRQAIEAKAATRQQQKGSLSRRRDGACSANISVVMRH